MTGRATVYSVRPDPSDSERRSVRLTRKAGGIALLLDLVGVPAGMVSGYQQGTEQGVRGLILESRAHGSSCSLTLRYPSEAG